jgi:uncharacterized protein YecE (DUF72 family)
MVARPRVRPQMRIGCSGWNYASWKGRFYPVEVRAPLWLHYYATQFDTVEVNNTFYRLPSASTFAGWRAATPDGFTMAVKASRYLTHLKRLRDPEEPVQRLFDHASALGPRLGPVLYQLPARFTIDLPRLEGLLRVLPPSIHVDGARRRHRVSHVFEFRDTSWYVDDTFALLAEHGASLCLHDKAGSAIDAPAVGPVVYVRFHGTSGKYHGSYAAAEIEAWAARLAEYWRQGRDVYAYFNNDPEAVATENARDLRARVRDRVPMPGRARD